MTPGARVAAAIEVLQDMDEGLAAEQALTRWARRSRFAGSKDRAAVRDHVFDVLRCRRSAAHYGKAETPRALMIGLLHAQGADLSALFSGEGHAPQPLSPQELVFPDAPQDRAVLWNLPDWLVPHFEEALGDAAEATALALQDRAPVHLRVNAARAERAQMVDQLAAEGITVKLNPVAPTALTVTGGARQVRNSSAYLDGLVELQDGASQAVVAELPDGDRMLDFCAGGGGKALAMAALPGRAVFAHDIDPGRMSDLPARAARAGATVRPLATGDLAAAGPFDVVLCDAPCSGAGAWRRAAEGKWTLTPDRLAALGGVQDAILDQAMGLVAPGGTLAYATCSVLRIENEDRVAAFLQRHPGWHCTFERRFPVDDQGDGFYTAHLKRV